MVVMIMIMMMLMMKLWLFLNQILLRVSSFIWRVMALLLAALYGWVRIILIKLARFISPWATLSIGFDIFLLKSYGSLSSWRYEYIIALNLLLLLLLLFRGHILLLLQMNFLWPSLWFAIVWVYSAMIQRAFLLILILKSYECFISSLIIVIVVVVVVVVVAGRGRLLGILIIRRSPNTFVWV